MLVVRVPQRLGTPTQLSDGTFALTSRDADGGLLATNDVANMELQFSTNLLNWVTLPNSLSLTNDLLLLVDPDSSNRPACFYRIIEH